MDIRKPPWLASFLDAISWTIEIPPWKVKVFTWTIADRGEWFSATLNIGGHIEGALDWILQPINAGLSLLEETKATFEALWDLSRQVFGVIQEIVSNLAANIAAEISGVFTWSEAKFAEVWGSIVEIVGNIARIIDNAVGAATKSIQEWTISQMAELEKAILEPWKQVLNTMSYFRDEIEDMFSDPEDYLIKKLESALDRFW